MRIPHFKKDGSLREAYEITQQINERVAIVAELQAAQEEAEILHHALLKNEELLEKARKIAAGLPTYPSYQEEIEVQAAEIEVLTAKAKNISRNFINPQIINGWEFNSHSGGTSKGFTVELIKKMGYGNIQIGGKPLIRIEETVDPKIWELAVTNNLVDLKKAKLTGAYVETKNTRRTAFKKEGGNQ